MYPGPCSCLQVTLLLALHLSLPPLSLRLLFLCLGFCSSLLHLELRLVLLAPPPPGSLPGCPMSIQPGQAGASPMPPTLVSLLTSSSQHYHLLLEFSVSWSPWARRARLCWIHLWVPGPSPGLVQSRNEERASESCGRPDGAGFQEPVAEAGVSL